MSSKSKALGPDLAGRVGLLALVLVTARANKRHFGLTTTWLPHLIGNTAALLAPELARAVLALTTAGTEARPADSTRAEETGGDGEGLTDGGAAADLLKRGGKLIRAGAELIDRIDDKHGFVRYVAPPALAYTVSHPRFNIYRGRLAEPELMGFGLDAVPHASTAFAMTSLIRDALDALMELADRTRAAIHQTPGTPLLRWATARPILASGVALIGLTALYEVGEYLIHRDELRRAGGDRRRINMHWSLRDTVFDVLANVIGWAAATGVRATAKGIGGAEAPGRRDTSKGIDNVATSLPRAYNLAHDQAQ